MRHESPARPFSREKRARLLMICALSILCLSQSLLAQSGRRPIKKDPPPPPAPAETRPEPAPPAEKPAPAAYLIVGADRLGSSMYILPGYVDEAVDACVKRLKKSPSLDTRGGGTMTRKDAIDRARKEKDAYVVWLEVNVEQNGAEGVSIGYTIFKPETAQVKTSGRVYLSGSRMGRGGVGVGVPSVNRRLPPEYLMREGGQDVADRVMGNFHVPLPSR
ncbi:MAG TPA: hypothetical protein VNH22_01800 [Blastocatellia bacterium]|nr:hypothetical protein [Blastocatellia bacterium]